VVVLATIAAIAVRGKIRFDQMRALSNPDRITIYERTILFELLVLALVLAGVWLNGTSVSAVLGDHWRTFREFLRHFGIGLLFMVATIVVTSATGGHRSAHDDVTRFLLPHRGAEMTLWILLSLSAGICEEAVYRGYLQKQFMALTRNVPAGIVLSALLFGAVHLYQGFARASLIAVMGAMSGALAFWVRSVRPGMFAHFLQDVLGGVVNH
jgi:membrane protease YdiL (CAAX protease family)